MYSARIPLSWHTPVALLSSRPVVRWIVGVRAVRHFTAQTKNSVSETLRRGAKKQTLVLPCLSK